MRFLPNKLTKAVQCPTQFAANIELKRLRESTCCFFVVKFSHAEREQVFTILSEKRSVCDDCQEGLTCSLNYVQNLGQGLEIF